MNLDDPKLTAFALDELDEPEKSNVAEAVASSLEARHEVDEIRGLAAALRSEFAANMERRAPASPEAQRSLSDIHGDRLFWTVARPLALAASLAVLGLIAAIVLGGRHLKIASPPSRTTEIELVDGSSQPKARPDSLPNPLQIELISSIDHAVIGEMPESGEDPGRVIEVIRDPARLAKLEDRLTTPRLRNLSPVQASARSYRIIFLDRAEHVIACANFSCANPSKPVLRLLPTRGGSPLPGNWESQADYSSYAIPFPDWPEAIGYCPGAG